MQATMLTFIKKTWIRRNNEKTLKKQKVLGVKQEKKLNHDEHKRRRVPTYLESCQSCIKDFCGDLPQTWTNTPIMSIRNTKKNALIGVVDFCHEECRKKVIKKQKAHNQ